MISICAVGQGVICVFSICETRYFKNQVFFNLLFLDSHTIASDHDT